LKQNKEKYNKNEKDVVTDLQLSFVTNRGTVEVRSRGELAGDKVDGGMQRRRLGHWKWCGGKVLVWERV
jgi:hypothetical protein